MARSPSPSGSLSSNESSGSAAASSSSSSSGSASASHAIGAQQPRPRHGEKRPFEPPVGFEPALHSRSVLDTFTDAAVSSSGQKQLWCIKVPDGIRPAQLNGLEIPVPDEAADDVLLQVVLDQSAAAHARQKSFTAAKSTSSKQSTKYTLRMRRGKSDDMDNARNAQGKSRRKEQHTGHESGMTQLIAMAGGNAILTQEAKGFGEPGNEEMESIQVMLPSAQGGRYTMAPLAISQYLQLTLEAPSKADITSRETGPDGAVSATSLETTGKSKHQQPWSKLNGFFRPAGARGLADEEDTQGKVHGSKRKSPSKKRKGAGEDEQTRSNDLQESDDERKKSKKESRKHKETDTGKSEKKQAKREKKSSKAA